LLRGSALGLEFPSPDFVIWSPKREGPLLSSYFSEESFDIRSESPHLILFPGSHADVLSCHLWDLINLFLYTMLVKKVAEAART